VHERALMNDVMRRIETVAHSGDATRVTRVTVRLGALSHFTPEHFRDHFADAAVGTIAEGAIVDAVVDAGNSNSVILESVEIEAP
jgi:hydrogenase nickel incorporation protein HypA/HybF